MERYVCLHGHFYQPPRENPWLEAIELQDSAYPYHDWNERVTAECYEANAASRILDGEGRIKSIVNNYARISFNFGPTLLSWLEEKTPSVYQALLEADRQSQASFSGHGSALAQAYNHMILPLANRADKYTQILWGLRDFEHRFQRPPEGMWLPETAVDLESLEILAELGLRFTILAPHQASRVRKPGARNWRDVSGARIDPTMPYTLRLPSGRSLAVFFYDGPISRAVAFEGLLLKGEYLADRLLGAFSDQRTWPQLVHIATDGETYGHHHRHGEMALAYALHHIESNQLARLTNYGEYLERHPPTHQVEIFENSSWSCVHGIERWRNDCGCNSGGHSGWNQAWRAPLRAALDWLRDRLHALYEEKARPLLKSPWAARNDYIQVVLDRSLENLEGFLALQAGRKLDPAESVTALKLLELQRHAMLMFTSCGWFFDELSGIETVQVIQYAGRALQLAQQFGDAEAESGFRERLAAAPSNLPEHGDGARIYDTLVKPAVVDLEKVGAHYAISSLFESYAEAARVYSYRVTREFSRSFEAGRHKLVLGRARFTSEITRESALLSFGVLHFGHHNLNCGVREFQSEEAFQEVLAEMEQAFAGADVPELVRQLDRYFGESTYSLRSLFRDEQRKIVNLILESTLSDVEAAYRQIYEHHAPLMRFLAELGTPLPKAFHTAAEFVLNASLRRAFEEDVPGTQRIGALLDAATKEKVALEAAGLGFALSQTIEHMLTRLAKNPHDLVLFEHVDTTVGLARTLPFEVNLWKAQNLFCGRLSELAAEFRSRTDAEAQSWVKHFLSLGEKLSVRVGPG